MCKRGIATSKKRRKEKYLGIQILWIGINRSNKNVLAQFCNNVADTKGKDLVAYILLTDDRSKEQWILIRPRGEFFLSYS